MFAPYLFFDRTLLAGAEDVASLYPTGATTDHPSERLHSVDPGAAAWQTEPWLAIEGRIVYEQHRMPFWDPFDGYGAPFAATMQPQPFYPPALALAAHPSPRTFAWFVVLRLFLAGWFAALFLRFFADRAAAACTGIATCLTGYYLLYFNMPHLSVDTTLPMVLWSTELIVRKQSPLRIAIAIVAAGMVYLGGMPETALLVLTVAAIYAIVRIALMRGGQLRAVAAYAGTQAGALLLGGAMLVPFLELEHRSLNQHDPSLIGGVITGLQADGGWSLLTLTELFPLAYGYPWAANLPGTVFSGTRGFFGCAVLMLALLSVIALRHRAARNVVVPTFAAIAVYCVLKRFGNPAVNWTGALPLLDLVAFNKYGEFVLGDAMAILAGCGVATLRNRSVTREDVVAAFGVTLFFASMLYTWNHAAPAGPHAWYFSAALSIGLIALLATAALAYATVTRAAQTRTLSAGFALIICGELCAGYALPQLWTKTAAAAHNPYAGAPYTKFLATHVNRNRERVLGLGGDLFPDWPGAFGFADPRSINALYPAEYIPFIRSFLATAPVTSDDEYDRFTGVRTLALGSVLAQRWMRLSSVGWLFSPTPLHVESDPPGAFLTRLWLQAAPTIPAANAAGVLIKTVTLGGVDEKVLFEHPPFDGVRYTTTLPASLPLIRADIGLDPGSYAVPPVCGGPVTFTLRALQGARVVRTSSMTIDPKHVLAQRRWIPFALDLRAFAGHNLTLQFATAAKDTCAAWAVWGEPRFGAVGDTGPARFPAPVFKPVFSSPDTYVYRFEGALPRLRLVHHASVAASPAAALTALTQPGFDVATDAIVDREIAPLGAANRADTVTVTSSVADEVSADVLAGSSGLLVQNDTYYPGWTATVDGTPAEIVRTDALFRGIVVASGHHVVVIRYQSSAVLLGEVLSLLGIAIVAGLAVWGLYARRTHIAATIGNAPAPAAT